MTWIFKINLKSKSNKNKKLETFSFLFFLNEQRNSIKKFNIGGVIHDDSALSRLKAEYERLLISEMRLSGYVPRIDISTDFTLEYNYTKQYFEFTLTMYGIYVGKKKSEWIIAVDETRPIYTQKSKSSVSSQAVE